MPGFVPIVKVKDKLRKTKKITFVFIINNILKLYMKFLKTEAINYLISFITENKITNRGWVYYFVENLNKRCKG